MPFEGPPGQPPPSGEGGTLELPPEDLARASGASLELQRRPNLELQRSPKLELSRLELKPEFRPGMVPPSPDREVMTRSPFKSGEGLPPPPPKPVPPRPAAPAPERPMPGEEASLEMSGWGEQGAAPPPPLARTPQAREQETIPVEITFTPRPTRQRGRGGSITPAQKALLGGFLLIVIAVLLWPRPATHSARSERPTPAPVQTPLAAEPATPTTLTLTQLTNPEFVGPREPARPATPTPAAETPGPAETPVAEGPAPVAPPVAPAPAPETPTPAVAVVETPAPPAPAEPLAVTVLTTPKDVQARVILAKDDLRYEESGAGSIKLSPDKAGSYKLKVSAPGFKPYQGTLKVAGSHRLAVALEALPAPAPPPPAPAYEPPPSYYQPPAYSGGGGGRSGGGGGGRYELPAPGL